MSTQMNEPVVRTYRGRSLEELIPRIRAELGPDAIILREREGLTGGVNGFFAQRCVEVDAQAPAPVDFYDDDESAMPGQEEAMESPPASEPEQSRSWPARPAPDARAPWESVAEDFSPAAAPESFAPAPVAGPFAAPAPVAAPEPSPAPVPVSAPETTPDTFAEPESFAGAEPPQYAEPVQYAEPTQYEEPVQYAVPTQYEQPAQYAEPAQYQEPTQYAEPAAPFEAPAEPPAPFEAPATPAAPDAPAAPDEELSFAERLQLARAEREASQPDPEPEPAAAVAPQPWASAPAAPAPAGPPVGVPGPEAPQAAARLDPALAGAVARELITHGVSETWAHELIVAAAAHLAPFAEHGDLRQAVRAGIAAGLSTPPPLPSSGAAVAFVGPAGAGKTRCAAALAAAYARASTLRVSVVSLADPGARSGEVETLLEGRPVPVSVARGEQAAEAVAHGRERGMVVLDSRSISPMDGAGVGALATELGALALDAVYLAVPATLSASAARSLLDGLGPAGPTAMVITHADESGELGIAAELAYSSGLPVAFIHGGFELDRSLFPADPARLAERLLP